MSDNDNERRSFGSRTPANTNPERVTYRRGFVTRHQVTGWRFVMRRIASGVALHDTRMLVDPLRTQSRAVLTGVLLVVTGVIGCFVFSLIRPGGSAGNDAILADRDTAALYIRVNDELHPVLNLASARLIAGRPDNPTMVKSAELDKFPRGALIGIPGAPERMVQSASRDGDWTLCEGSGASSADPSGLTIIAGALTSGGERATALPANTGVLVDSGAGTWLLWDGKRSLIDLTDRSVTAALGFPVDNPPVRPIAAGLLNAIPESAPLRVPGIEGAGAWPRFPGLTVGAPVASVVTAFGTDGAMQYYAVLPDGLQQVSPVLAAILRNNDSYGLQQPPRLTVDEISRLPVSRLLDTAAYPDARITLADATAAPVTCARWGKPADANTTALTLMSGATLPVADDARAVALYTGTGAARAYLTPGIGYLAQTVSAQAPAPPTGSMFWISDTGVRYGIDGGSEKDGVTKSVSALGLRDAAVAAPWSMLSLFAPGPTLSKTDALETYTGTENR